MKTPPQSSVKVFHEAAKKILYGFEDFCCEALGEVNGTCDSIETDFLEYLFKPKKEAGESWIYGWWGQNCKEPRLLALLLAAEITKRGSL